MRFSSIRCFTIKRIAMHTHGLLPAFVRDLLLQAALLQVRQSRSTQVIQKLRPFLFGEKDVRTRLTDHLNQNQHFNKPVTSNNTTTIFKDHN